MPRLGAIILTGGPSSRMGADKAELLWDGVRAVDRVADLAKATGAHVVVTVGTQDFGLLRAVEDPPGGGPVAGICAGAVALERAGCNRALVLAVDAPTITPQDLAPLLASPSPGAAYAKLHLPLVIDLAAIPRDAGGGWSMARLLTAARIALLAVPAEATERLRGANTPDERAVLASQDPRAVQNGGAG